MTILQTFWDWMVRTVGAALNTLNTMYNNPTLHDFFNIFLVVFGLMIVMKYIIHPLTGGLGSDKVKKKQKEDE